MSRKLRIGMLAPDFPPAVGGMEQYAWNLASALAETDDVTVFTRANHGLDGHRSFKIRRVLTGNLSTDLRAIVGTDVDVWLGLNCGLGALAHRLSVPTCLVCHGNDFLEPWVGFEDRHLRVLLRTPYLWRYHSAVRRRVRQARLRRGLKHAKLLIANSRATRDRLLARYPVCHGKVVVRPPGVAEEFFQGGDRSGSAGGELSLLTVARLSSPRKNIQGVLEALAGLVDTIRYRYVVVGDGRFRQDLEALADELGLGDRVRFVGILPPSELVAAYRQADLFILASKATETDVEGFGIVYLEAAASGVPSLCSREGGAVDAVEDGVTGFVLPDSSPGTIRRGIVRFASNREAFDPERIRAAARAYRWEAVARDIREYLRQAAGVR